MVNIYIMKNCSTSLVIACMHDKSLQLCPTLIRFPIHGILQARILEWVAMTSSRESSQARDRTLLFYVPCIGSQVLYHQRCLGSPHFLSTTTLITKWKHSQWQQRGMWCLLCARHHSKHFECLTSHNNARKWNYYYPN